MRKKMKDKTPFTRKSLQHKQLKMKGGFSNFSSVTSICPIPIATYAIYNCYIGHLQ